MKIFFALVLIINSFFSIGCLPLKNISFKKELIAKGGRDEAIYNAIIDFTNTSSKLYKYNSIFTIKTVEINEEIMVVRIGKNSMQLLLTDSTITGSIGFFPSKYFEKDDKLFFWWDDEYPLTDTALNVFKKYNLLQVTENTPIRFPDFVIDDSQKAAHYYFCKNDLTKYRVVMNNKAIGLYKPPKLNCKCEK